MYSFRVRRWMKLPCEHSRLDLIIAGTEDLELRFIIWDLCDEKIKTAPHIFYGCRVSIFIFDSHVSAINSMHISHKMPQC